MAETLRGDHYRMRCVRCGYPFDTGSDSLSLDLPQCPQLRSSSGIGDYRSAGQRRPHFCAQVHLSIFRTQTLGCCSFQKPYQSQRHYIKRLIGLPGENVQIIDGDIYIDGRIARKPFNIQHELWMPVYLQSYQPPVEVRSVEDPDNRNRPRWRQPFVNETGSLWRFDADRPSRFVLDEPDGRCIRWFLTPVTN